MDQAKVMRAGGDIRVCRFVKGHTADHTVVEGTANADVIGISQEAGREAPLPQLTTDPPLAGKAGDDLRVHTIGQTCLLRAGSGGFARFARLKSDGDGNGVPIATTGTTIQKIGAVALESAAAGELGKVQVVVSSERPALT